MAHQTEHARRASLAAAACPAADLPPLGTDPGAPAAVGPPTNDDAQGWGAKGIGDQRQSEQANCATSPGVDQDDRRFATLAALAAPSGIAIHELTAGYLLCRWGRCRELPDLRAVAALLRQIGVRA